MIVVLALLAVPAVYRISLMVTREEGPFSLFDWIRNQPIFLRANWMGRGIRCPLCISFWLSLVATPIVLYSPSESLDLRLFVLYWWGLAGIVAWFLHRSPQNYN